MLAQACPRPATGFSLSVDEESLSVLGLRGKFKHVGVTLADGSLEFLVVSPQSLRRSRARFGIPRRTSTGSEAS